MTDTSQNPQQGEPADQDRGVGQGRPDERDTSPPGKQTQDPATGGEGAAGAGGSGGFGT